MQHFSCGYTLTIPLFPMFDMNNILWQSSNKRNSGSLLQTTSTKAYIPNYQILSGKAKASINKKYNVSCVLK